MRTKYQCICDCCCKEIKKANDENDVSMNAAKYVLCPKCYEGLTAIFSHLQSILDKPYYHELFLIL